MHCHDKFVLKVYELLTKLGGTEWTTDLSIRPGIRGEVILILGKGLSKRHYIIPVEKLKQSRESMIDPALDEMVKDIDGD